MAKKKKAAKKKVGRKQLVEERIVRVAPSAVKVKVAKRKKKKAGKKLSGKCFVLMPFKEPFDTYYKLIIEPAVTKAGLKPQRGDSLFLPTPIMGDIWSMIQDAKVLVAEFTGKNPNVFYELGLGHAIGKPIVLISETMDDVPFDLQALRVILYNKDDPKWGEKLRTDIVAALKATVSEPVKAVPTMFRKKVKSQAPADSDLSVRLLSLERQVASLEKEGRGERMRKGRSISPSEARHILKRYMERGMSREFIVRRLDEEGAPSAWVQEQLDQAGYGG